MSGLFAMVEEGSRALGPIMPERPDAVERRTVVNCLALGPVLGLCRRSS